MSRIGKQPVTIPQGVTASVANGVVAIQGPKGKMQFAPGSGVVVKLEGGKLLVSAADKDPQSSANFGACRAILNNMVNGVATGFKRALELNGVGYTAKVQGSVLVLTVGYSHDVKLDIPASVKCVVNKNQIELESCDKALVGLFASRIRKSRPPEPYLGKGIKYVEEVIRRKAGKTAKK